jgi:hypothetical protein
MEFEELQKAWQEIKITPKTHDELRRMMYVARASHLRDVPRKEIISFCLGMGAMIALSWIFKLFSEWSTGLLMAVAFVEVLDQYVGLRYLRLLPEKNSLLEAMKDLLARVKLVLLLSRLAHAALWLVVVWFAATQMNLDFWKAAAVAVVSLPLVYLLSWWNARKWSQKINEVNSLLADLADDAERTVGA